MGIMVVLWLALYTVVAFTLFWIFFYQLINIYKIDVEKKPIYYKNLIFSHRLLGFLLFGPLAFLFAYPFLQGTPNELGFLIGDTRYFSLWLIGLLLALLLFNRFASQTKTNQEAYPQVRYHTWTYKFFFVNAVTWLVYLLGYEFLFRGLLLFPVSEVIGFWAAVGLNVVLYSIVHAPKGWQEVLGAIPFGIVLCIASHQTGGFWIAFIAHGSQAIINEFFTIRSNPDMAFRTDNHAISQQ